MKYTFVVNPNAGKGKGRKLLAALNVELKNRAVPHDVLTTEGTGHATKLAQESTSDIVVAVGGDGTVNEVANGLIGTDKILGIIPAGSGNDLVKSLGISKKFKEALAALFGGAAKRIDVATVTCWKNSADAPSTRSTRYFVNGVGIGFDAAVAERTNQMKSLSGIAVYVLAVFQTLGKYVAPTFKMCFDESQMESRKLLIAIGNGICAGGGFYLTPKAKIDDGYLDVCALDDFGIPDIVKIMPKVMRGAHEFSKGVEMFRSKRISVSSVQSFYVHADGEIVGRNVNAVEVAVIPRALGVIAGTNPRIV
ncbi:MAG: diacylglycerol kinase family lipid kinase [Ignavibacteriae bacterium]|nr:diacylglycerol kinase family lipid kinase [Ignavibacteriota bacterium]